MRALRFILYAAAAFCLVVVIARLCGNFDATFHGPGFTYYEGAGKPEPWWSRVERFSSIFLDAYAGMWACGAAAAFTLGKVAGMSVVRPCKSVPVHPSRP
jgi:hypothetical protein